MLNNIRKVKISIRLMCMGGVILILYATSIGIGLTNSNELYRKFFVMFDDRYKKIELINKLNNYSNKVTTQFMEVFLTKNLLKIQSIFNDIHTERTLILQTLNDLGEITHTDRGIQLLTDVSNSYNKCPYFENVLMQAINENRLDSEYQQLFNDIKHQHLQCEIHLIKLLEFQKLRMQEIIIDMENTKYHHTIIIVMLSILTLMIIIALIWWIILTINKPIREISIFVKRISQGEIPNPLTGLWEGEFDDIRKNINIMGEAIHALHMLDKYAEDLFINKADN